MSVQRAELQFQEESENELAFDSQSDSDEDEFFYQQRKTSKIISKINKGEIEAEKLEMRMKVERFSSKLSTSMKS